jgi:hypothetical protein
MNITIDNDNYFDIAEALHAVLNLWHDGGKGYEVLSKSQFIPGMAWRESIVERENPYFHEVESLVNNKQGYDEIEKLMDNLNDFMDNLKEDY